jgi:DNA-binding transcriptional MocR family regulator
VIANGTQTLVRILFERCAEQGGAVLAESLSYGVIRQLADLSRMRLVALPIDAEGIIPEAIETAARQSGARLLYCNPTVQNPTTATMPLHRREAIGAIARRLGLTIIEDDVLGPLHPEAPPPIASLAPDVTWYLQSTTKSLAHGLRVAFAVVPDAAARSRVIEPLTRLSFWGPAPLGMAVLTHWIETGAADGVLGAVRREAEARWALATRVLDGFGLISKPGSFHVWLPTGVVSGTEFAARATSHGVIVRPAQSFGVDASVEDLAFVRLSISSPIRRSDLQQGLESIRCLRAQI